MERANRQKLLLNSMFSTNPMPVLNPDSPRQMPQSETIWKTIAGNKVLLSAAIICSTLGLIYLSGFGMGALAWTMGKYKNLRDELRR